MSDNHGDNNSLKLYENERYVKLTKKHKSTTVGEPSSNFLQLVSIFENEESEKKCESLLQRRLTTATATTTAVVQWEEVEKAEEAEHSKRADELDETDETDEANEADDLNEADEARRPDEAEGSSADGSERSGRSGHGRAGGAAVVSGRNPTTTAAYTSTVSVTNHGGDWIGQPDRNLLFVIHPWCMLYKSDTDRQSEFPPPGFLERLKAKLMALHRQPDEQQQRHGPAAAAVIRRRRHTHQRIKCWFQYTATALGGGGPAAAVTTTVHAAYPRNEPAAVADFLSVWRRYANVAAACTAADQD